MTAPPALLTGIVMSISLHVSQEGPQNPEFCRQFAACSQIHIAQTDLGATVRDKLQQQQTTEPRRRTIVPAPITSPPSTGNVAAGTPMDAETIDKLRRVQRLIGDMEARRGTAPGTVKARPTLDGGINLEHDLSKLRGNFSTFGASPFGATVAIPDGANVTGVVTAAEIEYRVNNSHVGGEQVIALRSSGDVAATAFKSGEAPVSLQVTTAGLTARQLDAPGEELPVSVTVGTETKEMRPGQVERFGNIEVVVQASSNRSAKKAYIEGAPYALRLEVRSVP